MEDCKIKLAPIVLFTYNRPLHTQQTIEALLRNEYASESDLIVYSDGPKDELSVQKVEETRLYLKNITGFKSLQITGRKENWGLANNIIDGVTSVVHKYGRIIVLEDDLITSPYFLKYMNEALTFYEQEETVISIHSYIYPIKKKLPETFFIKGADCLGWGTWERGWNLFNPDGTDLLSKISAEKREKEFDFGGTYPYTKMLKNQATGKVGSWAIRWYASAFLKNKLTLYPGRSLVFHNGSDGSGTNCGISKVFEVELSATPVNVSPTKIEESLYARKRISHYLCYNMKINKVKDRLKNIFNSK